MTCKICLNKVTKMLNFIQNNKKYTKAAKDMYKQRKYKTHLKYMYFKYINNKNTQIQSAYRRVPPNPPESLLGKFPSQRGEERITGFHYSRQDI